MDEASDDVEQHFTGEDGLSLRLVCIQIGDAEIAFDVGIACAVVPTTVEGQEAGLSVGEQKKAKGRLQDIWMAETRKDPESAFDFFLEAYGPKYDKAAACLAKDRDVLLTFYDFPAEHWKHVRTTNPIESTFATVRLRTYRTKGCLSRKTAMAMVFKLCQCAQRKWRKLDGSNHLAEIIRGVKFVDGERQDRAAA